MKKIFIAMVLLVSLTTLLSGCAQKDPKEAFLELEQKSISIKEAKAAYDNILDGNGLAFAPPLTKLEYEIVFSEKGEKKKILTSMNILGTPITFAAYEIEGGRFICMESPFGEIECFKAEDVPELELEDLFTTIEEMSEGMSAIASDFTVEYGEDSVFIGRKCKGFIVRIKNKAFKKEQYNPFKDLKKYIKNESFEPETKTTYEMCLDEETGISLYEKVSTTFTTKDGIQVWPSAEMTITKLEFEVSDGEFELPAKVKPNCDKIRAEIEQELKKANYCEKDNDCIPAGEYSPYACNRFINRNADTTKLEGLAKTYSEGCEAYECPDMEPACVEGKCVIKTQNLKEKCCSECVKAAEQSFAGLDSYAAYCGTYPSGIELSEECRRYFEENKMTANDCLGTKLCEVGKEYKERPDCECPQGYNLVDIGMYVMKCDTNGNCWDEHIPSYSCMEVKPSVTIKTDKEEYEQGETVKAEIILTSGEHVYYDATLYPYSIDKNNLKITIQMLEEGSWVNVPKNCALGCGEIDCNSGMEMPCLELGPPRCSKLGEKQSWEWNQKICSYYNREIDGEKCEGINWLNAEPRAYRLSTTVFPEKEDQSFCGGELITIYSNEFTIKAPQRVLDKCTEDNEFAESVRSAPECEGVEFMCVDGWSEIYYYDERLTSATELPQQLSVPEELENAVIASYGRSSCDCINPISYHIISGGELKEASCESHYSFIEDYNAACNGCVLTWETGCC